MEYTVVPGPFNPSSADFVYIRVCLWYGPSWSVGGGGEAGLERNDCATAERTELSGALHESFVR